MIARGCARFGKIARSCGTLYDLKSAHDDDITSGHDGAGDGRLPTAAMCYALPHKYMPHNGLAPPQKNHCVGMIGRITCSCSGTLVADDMIDDCGGNVQGQVAARADAFISLLLNLHCGAPEGAIPREGLVEVLTVWVEKRRILEEGLIPVRHGEHILIQGARREGEFPASHFDLHIRGQGGGSTGD